MNHDRPVDGGQNDLLRRMQAADPARKIRTADSRIPDLVEATLSTTSDEVKSRSRRSAPAVAAAVLLAVGGGTYAFVGQGDGPGTAGESTVTTLAMPDAGTGTSTASCIQFDVNHLRDMPVAFSGTATEVTDDAVTLEVDRWYRGGDGAVVQLANYDPENVSLDGLVFIQGDRYLITATDGTVNSCGFSGHWSEELQDAFQIAFGS